MMPDAPVDEAFGLLLPIQSGLTSQVLDLAQELQHDRSPDIVACCRRLQLAHMTWYLAALPRGDVLIGHLQGSGASNAFDQLSLSGHSFDRGLLSRLTEISGVDLARGIGPAEHMIPLLDIRTHPYQPPNFEDSGSQERSSPVPRQRRSVDR